MYLKRSLIAGFLTLCLGTGAARAAMQLQAYDPKKHDRFYTGADKAFIGQPYDWSGVGRATNGAWATLISDHYFLTAAHDAPAVGSNVTFYEGNDTSAPHVYVVANAYTNTTDSGLPTDLLIGKLTTAAAGSIDRYPVLKLPTNSEYSNREIYTYGDSNRVGRNNIDDVDFITEPFDDSTPPTKRTLSSSYDFDNPGGVGADESYLNVGDSGAPSFAIQDGALALVGIHYAHSDEVGVNGSVSYDSFVPQYTDQIESTLSASTPAEHLVTVVPEPAILSIALIVPFAISRRARRTKAIIS